MIPAETKCCFEPFCPMEFGMASCSVKLKRTFFVFRGAKNNDGHFFGGSYFSLTVDLRNNPEFVLFVSKDRTHWPRCLFWHGWLPGLTSRAVGTLGLLHLVTFLIPALRMP